MSNLYEKVYGCLLGGLIGDSMGGPAEGKPYSVVEERFGWIDTFEGAGTDDSVIKNILTDAIFKHQGHITADEWAERFLELDRKFYPLYYAPVRNMFHKLQLEVVEPVYAGMENAPSSSSAMSIAPMGILNACDPRTAAAETYDVAGLVHGGSSTYCRDGACAIAAAIAEAMKPETNVDSIIHAATAYLHPKSSAVMIDAIHRSMDAVKSGMDYKQFRAWFYDNCLQKTISDSRETIPATFALFYLAEGDLAQAAIYSANFGRDSDTIGTMAAAIAGAYQGAGQIRAEWIAQVEAYYGTSQPVSSGNTEYGGMEIDIPDYRQVAQRFVDVIKARNEEKKAAIQMVETQL